VNTRQKFDSAAGKNAAPRTTEFGWHTSSLFSPQVCRNKPWGTELNNTEKKQGVACFNYSLKDGLRKFYD